MGRALTDMELSGGLEDARERRPVWNSSRLLLANCYEIKDVSGEDPAFLANTALCSYSEQDVRGTRGREGAQINWGFERSGQQGAVALTATGFPSPLEGEGPIFCVQQKIRVRGFYPPPRS